MNIPCLAMTDPHLGEISRMFGMRQTIHQKPQFLLDLTTDSHTTHEHLSLTEDGEHSLLSISGSPFGGISQMFGMRQNHTSK